MLKKYLSTATALFLAATMLTGCAGSASPAGAPSGGSSGEITYWTSSAESEVVAAQKLIAEFNKEYPNIKVNYENFPDFFQKVTTAFSANAAPDVVCMYGSTQPYAKGGKLAPVPESVMSKAELESTFAVDSLKNRLTDGQYYGIPAEYNVESPGLLVNLDLVEKAGLTIPQNWIDNDAPANWGEVVDFAKKLTVVEGGIVKQSGLSYLYSQYEAMFLSLIWQYGGDYRDEANSAFHFDTPEARKAIEFMLKYTQGEDKTQEASGSPRYELLTNGTAAMVVGAPWYAASLDTDYPTMRYQYFNLPAFVDGAKPHFLGEGGWGYVVNSESKNQEAAWQFVKFLSSKDSMTTWSDSLGAISARKDVSPEAAYDKNVGSGTKARAITAKVLEYGMDGGSFCMDTSQLVWTIVRQNLNAVIAGEVSVDDCLKAMDEQANQLIQDNLSR